jgi:hypothetical protein
MLVVLFYWLAFMATIWWCFNALMALWAGHFIRAAIWGSLGVGMIYWWQGDQIIPHPGDVYAWLKGSAWVVGFGAFLTLVRFCRRYQQATQAAAPLEAAPMMTFTINDDPVVEHTRRRRLPRPTIINQ